MSRPADCLAGSVFAAEGAVMAFAAAIGERELLRATACGRSFYLDVMISKGAPALRRDMARAWADRLLVTLTTTQHRSDEGTQRPPLEKGGAAAQALVTRYPGWTIRDGTVALYEV